MIINKFQCDGFKNLKKISFNPHPRLNIIFGKNAQGKTNLLEAIWLCSGVSSFRGTKDKNMIGFGLEKADISLDFQNSQREQNITLGINTANLKKKYITRNGVRLNSTGRLFGELCCVIFTPEDLNIAGGSPDVRRRFLDLSISQVKVSYASIVANYEKIIEQRNALLKDISYGKSEKSMLLVWDEQLAMLGSYMAYRRKMYCEALQQIAYGLYNDISSSKEELTLYYKSNIYKADEYKDIETTMRKIYYDALRNSEQEDIRLGYTTCGVHRDDLEMKINGVSVKEYGSQGQKRSCALILKLAAAYIFYNLKNEMPIILLDDILSELDTSRQQFVLNNIRNMQVFITCCDRQDIEQSEDCLTISIEDGKINKVYKGDGYVSSSG